MHIYRVTRLAGYGLYLALAICMALVLLNIFRPAPPKASAAPRVPVTITEKMEAAGIPVADWGYVDFIVHHESSWCHTRWQGYHGTCHPTLQANIWGNGALGLCQSYPAAKMASAGADWQSNPVTQLKWCDTYARSRYGGWYQAYRAWTRQHCW